MKKAIQDQCPMGFEKVALIFDDPDELVMTQRKVVGHFQKVLRPRREVKGSMSIEIHCPVVSRSKPMTAWNPPNPWCSKRNNVCPIYEIARALLKRRGFSPNKARVDIIKE